MRRYKQFLGIFIATGVFGAIAVSGFGGWPVLVIAGLVAIALVDAACRQMDRESAGHLRGAIEIAGEPEIRIIRPAVESERAA